MTEVAQISLRELGYLEESETADLLEVSVRTLRNWRQLDKGPPAAKIHGDRTVYSLEGIRKWLAGRTEKRRSARTLTRGAA